MTDLSGRCLCGAVAVTVVGTAAGGHDRHAGAGHCRMCQRWTGGAFVAFFAAAAAVAVAGPVARYPSSAFGERAFCPTCGSHLWFRGTREPDACYELTPGLFDDARGFPLQHEIYSDRALAAVRFAGEHRRTTRADYEARENHVEGDA